MKTETGNVSTNFAKNKTVRKQDWADLVGTEGKTCGYLDITMPIAHGLIDSE